uniref:Endonuclease/exonuclease/phosphatase domain-containing protein n=1 Tax=Ciona savignyi TaxID=51511 RepID=H2YIL1_CIOSA
MDKPQVVDILIEIVQRYDILMIQEIRDSAGTALPELVDDVNAVSSVPYDFVVSPRTGRTSSKEQYGYIFRSDKVSVIGEYQWPDNADVFEREPYSVQFSRKSAGSQKTFSYISIHAKPDDAVSEIDHLDDVYDDVAKIYGEDAMIAGDFNADCSYVCSTCWQSIDMWTDPRFTWLIGSNVDTTVSSTDCAYDRIVVAGSAMTANSGPGSVFRFDLEYKLSYEETKDVSDHYPVEFLLN